MEKLYFEEGDTIIDLLKRAYSAGWYAGYKARGVEFDWIDEGFQEYKEDCLYIKEAE